MSTDFVLDGDIRLYMELATGDAVTLQAARRRLLTFGPHRIAPTDGTPPIVRDGEWILDGSVGMPLLNWRAQKPPNLQEIRAFVFAELAGVDGVESVLSVQAVFDIEAERVVVTARIRLVTGTIAALEFTPALGGNALPYVGILYPSLRIVP